MTSSYLHRNCPICGAAPPSNPEIASSPPAETMEFDELVPCWNGLFKAKVFFSYCRCPSCQLLYSPIFFTGEQLEKLYAQMPPNMDIVPRVSLEKTQAGYFDILQREVDLKGKLIEVGPDIGLFAKNCVERRAFDEYWLFEPNRDVEPALRGTMGDSSFHIIHDMA